MKSYQSIEIIDKEFFLLPHSEEETLVAMLRFQEFERSTVDTEGAMGLAAILAGQLPELRGKKWVRPVVKCTSLNRI